jgi:hypothetical protein
MNSNIGGQRNPANTARLSSPEVQRSAVDLHYFALPDELSSPLLLYKRAAGDQCVVRSRFWL